MAKGILYQPKYWIKHPSIQINEHLQKGGIPSGSIVQIQSDGARSFKSSTAIQMLANAQEQGLVVGYYDSENALTEDSRGWLENLGLNVDECYFKEVTDVTGEQAFERITNWIVDEGVKVIVLDSIHSTQPEHVHESDVGQHHIGNHATLHKQGLIKIKALIQQYDVVVIAINHLKVNLTQRGAFGKKPTGGSAWEFYSEFIFQHKKSESRSALEGEDLIPLDIYIDKNKGGKSYISANVFARQGYGIDTASEILMLALEAGTIEKRGAWFRYEGEPIAQGQTSAIEWVRKNMEKFV